MAKKDRARNRKAERFEVEDTMSAEHVAGYLEGIAQGLRQGTIALGEQGESFRAEVSSDIDFEVEARHGKRKSRIEISLKFRATGVEDEDESADDEDREMAEVATIPDEMTF